MLLPVYLGALLWRSRREPLYRARLWERFGIWQRSTRAPVWVFAASLGETRAVSPVVKLLLRDGYEVVLTHSSPAGLTAGQKLFPDEIASGQLRTGYVPLDLFWTMSLFLRRLRPQIGIAVEMETWPGQLFGAYRRSVPMVQVNGNYIEKSLQRDLRRLGIRPLLFGGYSRITTKSETRRATYLGAGVPSDRIKLVGELKFDQDIETAQLPPANALRDRIARPTLMIASSIEAEEEQLMTLVRSLKQSALNPLIVWVPRSPQRFAAVAGALRDAGYSVALRSRCLNDQFEGAVPKDTDVLIGDSLGEMAFYYQLSDIVFVGASLVEKGGHNIIEPLAQGKPVLMGPSFYGVAFPANEAAEAGAFESLPTAEDVAKRSLELFSDASALRAMSQNAAQFNGTHTGAAQRTIDAISPFMKGP
ncbi:MAG: hypothetical protein HRU32_14560 [Rhodobacteraceae bacterium]|nr:hypothetical protein [Paracoccaceae bacterium]